MCACTDLVSLAEPASELLVELVERSEAEVMDVQAAFNFDPVVSNLFAVRPDGSGLRQLTHSTTANDRATQAHFTPDGRIIYTRVTPSGRTLWLINADGSNASPIPANGERIRTHGDWQPTPR